MAGEDVLERVDVEAIGVVGDAQHSRSRLLHRDERAHVRRGLGVCSVCSAEGVALGEKATAAVGAGSPKPSPMAQSSAPEPPNTQARRSRGVWCYRFHSHPRAECDERLETTELDAPAGPPSPRVP